MAIFFSQRTFADVLPSWTHNLPLPLKVWLSCSGWPYASTFWVGRIFLDLDHQAWVNSMTFYLLHHLIVPRSQGQYLVWIPYARLLGKLFQSQNLNPRESCSKSLWFALKFHTLCWFGVWNTWISCRTLRAVKLSENWQTITYLLRYVVVWIILRFNNSLILQLQNNLLQVASWQLFFPLVIIGQWRGCVLVGSPSLVLCTFP